MGNVKRRRCRHVWVFWFESYAGQEGQHCAKCWKKRVIWGASDQALWVAALTMLYTDGWGDAFTAQYFVEDWLKALLRGR